MLPISQLAAGYLLLLIATLTLVEGFAVRWLVRRKRGAELVRRLVGWFRELAIAQLLGPIQSDVLTDEEIDDVILTPAILLFAALLCGGVFLIATDTFYVRFVFFKH